MTTYSFRTAAFIGVATLLLGGCSAVSAEDTESVEPVPAATEAPSDVEQDAQDAPIDTAPNGDILATVGEQSGLVGPDGTSAFNITVTDLGLESECPSKLEDGTTFAPENGRFLVADVSATLTQDFASMTDHDTPFLTVDSDVFEIVDLNGVTQSDSHTVSAYGCYTNDQRIVPFVNPGESVEGLVVLDTDLEHGYLVYNPWGVDGSGWRWEF